MAQYVRLRKAARKALERNRIDQALAYAHASASLAWLRHPGIWRDDDLERIVIDAGRAACTRDSAETSDHTVATYGKGGAIVIVSSLRNVGGHTKAVQDWKECLMGTMPIEIVVTNSGFRASMTPEWIEPSFVLGHKESLAERVRLLRNHICRRAPQVIILFTHPNDVVALGALAALDQRPRTIFFDHADHVFWLGATVCDEVVHFRAVAGEYAAAFRHLPAGRVVQLRGSAGDGSCLGMEVRAALNAPADALLSLSVGSYYKMQGDPSWDFLTSLTDLLKAVPELHHVVVTDLTGRSLASARRRVARCPRLHLLGPTSDLTPFYMQCDFLVETFPMIGGMVRQEAMRHGLPILAVHNPRWSLLSDTDDLPSDYVWVASSPGELVRHGKSLAASATVREMLGKDLAVRHANCAREIPGRVCTVVQGTEPPTAWQAGLTYDAEYAHRLSIRLYPPTLWKGLFWQSWFLPAGFPPWRKAWFALRAVCAGEVRILRELAFLRRKA